MEDFLEVQRVMELSLEEGRDLMALTNFIETVIRTSGLLAYYTEKDKVAATGKVGNMEQLIHAAGKYPPGLEGLTQFLEDMELDQSLTEEEGKTGVTLITMHNTKGLEFDRVIITGMEEGLFPSARSEDENNEEERRIFYVSLTRARRELYLTACRHRFLWGKWQNREPSPFLREIPREAVEVRGTIPPALNAISKPGKEDGYHLGAGVYHDDYGPGVVCKRWYKDSHLLVLVRFESGRSAQFMPQYTPLETIAYD